MFVLNCKKYILRILKFDFLFERCKLYVIMNKIWFLWFNIFVI